MEESKETPTQVTRFHSLGLKRFQADGMYDMNIVECNKKRKLQSDQLDLLRPKHKCWVGNVCSEHDSMSGENPVLEGVLNQMVKIRTDEAVLDDRSEPESAKDSNSFIEDSDTAMSVNKEAKLEADCANTYLYGHVYSEYAKDSTELSVEEEFEDFLLSNGVNPNMYVLSSGRWEVNQEAQSSTRPPTIDQEFEDYFSMLML